MSSTNKNTAGFIAGAATSGSTGEVPVSIHDYLATTAAALSNDESMAINSSSIVQPNISSAAAAMLAPDLSAFLMAADAERSIPGSPSVLMSNLGFHSIQGSPILAPSLPQSPTNGFSGIDGRHSFTNLAALAQHNQQRNCAQNATFFGFDSAVNSAVQSATASPTTGALNRRGLLNSMANLNMTQLPPTAVTASTAYIGPQGTVDTIGTGFMESNEMFNSQHSPFSKPATSIGANANSNTNTLNASVVPSVSINGVPSGTTGPHPIHIASRQPYVPQAANVELQKHIEETKARGLNMTIEGIPKENAKSRVETQIKITLRLTTDGGERVTCWSHLALPEMLVSREKFRHRLQKHAPGESGMPASPQHVVHLEAGVICSSDPTRKVETCIGCIRREYKRSLRRKDARLRSSAVQSACTTPAQSRAPSPTSGSPSDAKGMTGTMEADWDKARIAVEKQRIVIFNCNDLLDFSKGEVVLPTRITCYCRHHNEKVGFCICLTLRDSQGAVLKTLMSPPIMITDDHKSTKFKTDRKIKTKAEYERQGDGNAAYANHALSGLGSPHGVGSHLTESPSGHLGFRGGRQAMSARNSPTLRPYGHPHMLLDTYSQFASLAGTPSLNNSPIGSPPMVASHMVGGGGFESSFHLPQAALGGGYHVSGPSLFSNLAGSPAVGSDTATAAAAAATAALVANYNSHGQQHQQQHHHHHHHHQQMSNPDGSSTLAPPGMLPISSMYGTMPGQHMSMSSTLGLHPSLSSGVGPVFSGDSLSAAGLVAPQAGHGSDSSIRIAQMMPAQGPVVGGTSVLIAGRGFHPNIAVYFGTAQASRVQVLSSFNMTCVLPPSKASGPVAVRIRDLSTMTVYEGNGSVADLNSSTLQSSNHSIFTYINDTDQAMLELALQIIGLLPNDKSSSASGTSASPQMSPVMQTRSPGSSRMSSPTGAAQQNAKNKIIQDQSIMGVLRALRTANDSHDMEEIEAHLLKLLSTVLSRSIIESSRLNTAHEATGRLLIHFASLLGMVNLARFLVSNGALFDETDNSGMTALHLACMYNENASVVELLLNSGASFRVKSNLAQTPLDIAQSVGNKKAQMLLEEREGYSKFIKEDHLAENTGEAKSISVSGVSSEPTANMFHQSFAAGMMPAGNVAVDAQGHSSVAGLFSHAGGGSEAAIFSDGSGLFGSSLLFGSQQQQQNQHLHLSNPNMQPPYHQQHYQQ